MRSARGQVKDRQGQKPVDGPQDEDVYHISNAIKLGAYNVGREGKVLTVPLYMGFLVKDTLADVIIPDVDLSRLATT